jgi:hypothetical protein
MFSRFKNHFFQKSFFDGITNYRFIFLATFNPLLGTRVFTRVGACTTRVGRVGTYLTDITSPEYVSPVATDQD